MKKEKIKKLEKQGWKVGGNSERRQEARNEKKTGSYI